VRYQDPHVGSHLVSPGGAVEENEGLAQAAVRETFEETRVTVTVRRLLADEDLICSRDRMCNVWFLSEYISGEARVTTGAVKEGITLAAWFSRHELANETVLPPILLANDWVSFASDDWIVKALEVRRPNF
jgi:ADP-ribose pyrophosphatase YjhB (NUDIX family)